MKSKSTSLFEVALIVSIYGISASALCATCYFIIKSLFS